MTHTKNADKTADFQSIADHRNMAEVFRQTQNELKNIHMQDMASNNITYSGM